MKLALWHFHIEVSSKCALSCPRCPRQEVPDTLVQTQLRLDFFKKNFTKEFITEHVDKITFCGDDGDPIYATDFIAIINYIKSIKDVEIVIVTNGSGKPAAWWAQLSLILTERDTIHFSIDGWDQNSNNIYRVGSDWNSISEAFRWMCSRSKARVVWDAIAFKFNEDYIEFMKGLAKVYGADEFQLTLSTKFGSFYPSYGADDPLEPSSKYISSTHRFQRQHTYFTPKRQAQREKTEPIEINGIKPICYVGGKGLFINSQGHFFPCCWVANRYSHNNEWVSKFDLNNTSLTDILQDKFWNVEFQTFKWQECQTKCKSTEVTIETANDW